MTYYHGQSVPTSTDGWDVIPHTDDSNEIDRGIHEHWKLWNFLHRFFSSHGYFLYDFDPTRPGYSPRPPKKPVARCDRSDAWPWARAAYNDEHAISFPHFHKAKIWPARRTDGREVIIRLVSDRRFESDELKVFRRLNTPEARKDPRNHTLPVIEYLNYDGLVFVVMPRWEALAFNRHVSANRISELFDLAETFFEGLEFLHENRIAHGDILYVNVVINTLVGVGCVERNPDFGNRRTKGEVRYAFIDWGHSVLLPYDCETSTAWRERQVRRPHWDLSLREGLCNPFTDDVLMLAAMIREEVFETEKPIEGLNQFFDNILKCEYKDCPTATQALVSLRRVRSTLSDAQLNAAPIGDFRPR